MAPLTNLEIVKELQDLIKHLIPLRDHFNVSENEMHPIDKLDLLIGAIKESPVPAILN